MVINQNHFTNDNISANKLKLLGVGVRREGIGSGKSKRERVREEERESDGGEEELPPLCCFLYPPLDENDMRLW